jgi:succinate dehydrogenase / fumarate reductase, cytochrome b subunit
LIPKVSHQSTTTKLNSQDSMQRKEILFSREHCFLDRCDFIGENFLWQNAKLNCFGGSVVFFSTYNGKKFLMGLAGLIWSGFVFVHMMGNFLLLKSADSYNVYAHNLTQGPLIYLIEAILLGALAVHFYCAISLTLENKKARGPEKYLVNPQSKEKGGGWISSTMWSQGIVLLCFLVFHIATFKYGTYYETTINGVVMRDLFRLVHEVFQNPQFVALYVVVLVVLGLHLSHGFWSAFQSLGLLNDSNRPFIKKMSRVYAITVFGGFVVQPIYLIFSSF